MVVDSSLSAASSRTSLYSSSSSSSSDTESIASTYATSNIEPARRSFSASEFTLLEELGSGSFGVVYRAVDNVMNRVVAIKKIDMENSEDDIDEIQKEISILAGCKDSRITKYYGCFVKGYKLWIIMEYLGGGSCLDLLKPGPFDEASIAIVCRELLLALKYLHENGKIHRDVKAANVLVSADGDVKIADFGVATQLSNNLSRRNTFVGTPFWMAPEVIQQEDYGYKADIWSLGITAMEFALGEPPLSDYHPMKVLFLIPKNDPPRLSSGWSKDFREFVEFCLQKDPSQRASVRQLLKHRFIRNAGKKSHLIGLIERREQYGGRRKPKVYQPTIQTVAPIGVANDDDEEDDGWDFDTVKPPNQVGYQDDNYPSPPMHLSAEPSMESLQGTFDGSTLGNSMQKFHINGSNNDNHHSTNDTNNQNDEDTETDSATNTTKRIHEPIPKTRGVISKSIDHTLNRVDNPSDRLALDSIKGWFTDGSVTPHAEFHLVRKIVQQAQKDKNYKKIFEESESSRKRDPVEELLLNRWLSKLYDRSK